MAGAPRLPRDLDPARVLLADVDGDGAADLVVLDARGVTVWVNRGGGAWSEPITVPLPIFEPSSVSLDTGALRNRAHSPREVM